MIINRVVFLLCIAAVCARWMSAAPAPQIAFTFDDLPAHSALPPGETRLGTATKIITALRDAHVPSTYGFVNAASIEQHPGDASVLDAWRAAGNLLGNHAWSHINLNQRSLEEFEAEVTRDEPAIAQRMKNADWHWFRFPFLAEGNTPEKKAGIRMFLRDRGYKIAGVTMSFGDYQWNEPYARCKAKGDPQGIDALETSYLDAAANSIAWYRTLSQTLYGRDIPYVLLMHIGEFDAEMLPRLLKLYESKGFVFITLEQAERDAFYKQVTDLSVPPGPDSLEGIMAERKLPIPQHPPFAPPQNVCR